MGALYYFCNYDKKIILNTRPPYKFSEMLKAPKFLQLILEYLRDEWNGERVGLMSELNALYNGREEEWTKIDINIDEEEG